MPTAHPPTTDVDGARHELTLDLSDIHGFWTLVGATLIVWVVNMALDLLPAQECPQSEVEALRPPRPYQGAPSDRSSL